MNDLHPRDEMSIRKGSSPVTLTAKQIEAAQLQAKLSEWLAQGNQINTAQNHELRVQQFNQGHVLSGDKTQSYKFEIAPEGKPKPKRKASQIVQKKAIEALRVKSEKRRSDILQIMRALGRPVTATTVAQKIGLSTHRTNDYLNEMINRGQVELVGKLINSKLYGVVNHG